MNFWPTLLQDVVKALALDDAAGKRPTHGGAELVGQPVEFDQPATGVVERAFWLAMIEGCPWSRLRVCG
jgi:hypothetical protein